MLSLNLTEKKLLVSYLLQYAVLGIAIALFFDVGRFVFDRGNDTLFVRNIQLFSFAAGILLGIYLQKIKPALLIQGTGFLLYIISRKFLFLSGSFLIFAGAAWILTFIIIRYLFAIREDSSIYLKLYLLIFIPSVVFYFFYDFPLLHHPGIRIYLILISILFLYLIYLNLKDIPVFSFKKEQETTTDIKVYPTISISFILFFFFAWWVIMNFFTPFNQLKYVNYDLPALFRSHLFAAILFLILLWIVRPDYKKLMHFTYYGLLLSFIFYLLLELNEIELSYTSAIIFFTLRNMIYFSWITLLFISMKKSLPHLYSYSFLVLIGFLMFFYENPIFTPLIKKFLYQNPFLLIFLILTSIFYFLSLKNMHKKSIKKYRKKRGGYRRRY